MNTREKGTEYEKIAAKFLQNHGVIIFARHVVGEAERICAEVGFPVFRNSSRKNGRHGKKGGSLVKVIYNS